MDQLHPSLPTAATGTGGGSPFDQIMLLDHSGEERWSARDLQKLVGYDRWERFAEVVERAIETINASGLDGLDHIRGAAKVMEGGRWGRQQVKDYRLTRFGAYHVALAADGRKPEVAAAKTYFAIQTRNAEVAAASAPALPQDYEEALVELLAKVRENKALTAENKVLAPKAGKWDAFCDSDGLIDMNAASHALTDLTGGLGRTKFMELLRSDDVRFLQTQNPRLPYREHERAGRAHVKLVETPAAKWVEQTFFTPRGLDWLVDQLGGNYLPLPAA
ncbi:phage antirepressor KilAC domain-containing protein [Streptomyces sp. bgisy031]|uniref:phage antirepressor KilAC domain-containing protein n=1 Tax=Streptomyces sp. bgisy031 TaxID=3413772 RepID=UPI003D714161